MSNTTPKTVLVTGANAGLGLETARQLAALPAWTHIVIGARSEEKATAAQETVAAATGRAAADFSSLLMDFAEPDSVASALKEAASRDLRFDALVLNAGGMAPSSEGRMTKTSGGLSKLFAMNVGGHAQLVAGLLEADRLNEGATIVFAGSEASRGVPMMGSKAPTVPSGHGTLDEALWAVATGEHITGRIDDMYEYGLVKLIGAAWMRQLASTHGSKLRALCISPGMTGGTNGADSMPAVMRVVMKWIAIPMMSLIGSAHNVAAGAARYLQGLSDASLVNGGFYGSPGKGLTGELTRQSSEMQPLLEDDLLAEAVGRLLERVVAGESRLAA